jgi:hypothetical protein
MSQQHPEWTASSREQITTFYTEEFPDRLQSEAPPWVSPSGPVQYAAALSDTYPLGTIGDNDTVADFIRRETRVSPDEFKTFSGWDDVYAFFQHPAHNDPYRDVPDRIANARNDVTTWLASPTVAEGPPPVTEAAYYGVDHTERWWVLAFDIDAKDIAAAAVDGVSIGGNEPVDSEAALTEAPPAGFPYRFQDIDAALSVAFELKEWLHERVEASDVYVFYSGQGTHVYVEDDDTEHRYTKQSREFLLEYLVEHEGYPLDEHVTADDARVMRLPGSLHTDVSRVVTDITDNPNFDYRSEAVPTSFEPTSNTATHEAEQ